jgi:transcriptional regulator with XRE-family HTH domain
MSLSSAQCRAARGLLNWSQSKLAEKSKVATKTIAEFEVALREPQIRTLNEICRAFENEGVEFLNHARPGVRLKLRPARSTFDEPLRIISSSALSVRLRSVAESEPVTIVVQRNAIDDRFRLRNSTAQQRRDLIQANIEHIGEIAGVLFEKRKFSRGQSAGSEFIQIVLDLADLEELQL